MASESRNKSTNITSLDGAQPFQKEIAKMEDSGLIAQEIMQQGAIHAMSFLINHGATEQMANDMLASLRENAADIRREARRRGTPVLFAKDQTEFS